jgi:hypothetical protein
VKVATHFELTPMSRNVGLYIHSPTRLHGVVLISQEQGQLYLLYIYRLLTRATCHSAGLDRYNRLVKSTNYEVCNLLVCDAVQSGRTRRTSNPTQYKLYQIMPNIIKKKHRVSFTFTLHMDGDTLQKLILTP